MAICQMDLRHWLVVPVVLTVLGSAFPVGYEPAEISVGKLESIASPASGEMRQLWLVSQFPNPIPPSQSSRHRRYRPPSQNRSCRCSQHQLRRKSARIFLELLPSISLSSRAIRHSALPVWAVSGAGFAEREGNLLGLGDSLSLEYTNTDGSNAYHALTPNP
ncbi:MAG: hypothetical protein MUC60_13285 [Oscillatoria sp. Prado101]|nr:hypothetical protein [Oscillatoria sp. Prado101]